MPNAKNTNKKKTAAPKKAKKKTRSAPKKKMVSKTHSPLVRTICSLTDPFCKHALGAKYLDGAKVRTLSLPLHYQASLVTDASGKGSIMFYPGWNCYYWPSTMAGTIATWVNGANAPPMTNATGYRVVTAGVIARTIVAPLSASAMVRIRTFNSPFPTNLNAVDIASYNCNEYEDIPLAETKEVAISATRTNDVQARTLIAPWAVNGVFVDNPPNGWSYTMISVDGGPASQAVLNLEFFVNFEITFADESSNSLLALPSPPANPLAIAASELVSSETKAIVRQGIVSFGKQVTANAVEALGNALASRMGMIAIIP